MKRLSPKLIKYLLGAGTALTLLLILLLGMAVFYQARVLPRTYVAGVSIGGMTIDAAQAAITQTTQQAENKPLKITYQSQTVTETPTQMGIVITPPISSTGYLFGITSLFRWTLWADLFSVKNIALAYSSNQQTVTSFLTNKFNIAKQPTNAHLSVSNGVIVVTPSTAGETLDVMPVITAITTGSSSPIVLSASPSPPAITTSIASQTKTDIVNSVYPLMLTNNNQTVTIPVEDIYSLIDFNPTSNGISWHIDKTKMTSYINSKIAPKVNVAMVQTITQTQPDNTVTTTPGSSGLKIDTATLTNNILSAITNKSTASISIPTVVVPVTTKVIGPNYIAGMFPGLYVYVNLASQMMYVLNGITVAQTFKTSTGAGNTPTPPGQYYIYNKLALPRSPLYNALWMPDWSGISTDGTAATAEGYGIHALPCFDITCHLVEGSRDLGVPVSHGCIRLSAANALWFYTNVPVGTPVYVAKN